VHVVCILSFVGLYGIEFYISQSNRGDKVILLFYGYVLDKPLLGLGGYSPVYLSRRHGFDSRAFDVRFVVERAAVAQVLRVLTCSPVSITAPVFHSFSLMRLLSNLCLITGVLSGGKVGTFLPCKSGRPTTPNFVRRLRCRYNWL
jgi:hypothetical protein